MLFDAVGGAIGLGDYLEAGSIVFLFTLADWLESRSSDKVSCTLNLFQLGKIGFQITTNLRVISVTNLFLVEVSLFRC